MGTEISKNVWLRLCTVRERLTHSFRCQSAIIWLLSPATPVSTHAFPNPTIHLLSIHSSINHSARHLRLIQTCFYFARTRCIQALRVHVQLCQCAFPEGPVSVLYSIIQYVFPSVPVAPLQGPSRPAGSAAARESGADFFLPAASRERQSSE